MAVAPWVLVPLVALAYGGRLRPAVTRSAIAVACAGGVNATAVLAILPPALIWLALLATVAASVRGAGSLGHRGVRGDSSGGSGRWCYSAGTAHRSSTTPKPPR